MSGINIVQYVPLVLEMMLQLLHTNVIAIGQLVLVAWKPTSF